MNIFGLQDQATKASLRLQVAVANFYTKEFYLLSCLQLGMFSKQALLL